MHTMDWDLYRYAVSCSWPRMWRTGGMVLLALCLSGCAAWASLLSGPSAQSLVSAKPLAVLSDPKAADYIQFQKYTLPCASRASEDVAGTAPCTSDASRSAAAAAPSSSTPVAALGDSATALPAQALPVLSPTLLAEQLNFLGRVALDSETKCLAFLNGVVIAENSVNTTGDIVSTLLTSAGTVFKSLTTVHSLTAGATVATGSKTAVDANIYAKASIANFQTALQKSYFKSINDYVAALPGLTNFLVSAEIAKIETIHATCTLAAAEGSIAATIASPTDVPAKPTGVTATPFNGAVQLSWSSATGATAYSIYRGTTAGGEAKTAVKSVDETSYVDTVPNGTYFYKITAKNTAGESAPSDEVQVTPASTLKAPPASPTKAAETHGAIPGAKLQ